MSVATELHIKKLASQALYMESQDRPSSECYPMYIQTLYCIFHAIHSECSDRMSAQTLLRHESLLNLAAKLVSKGHEHAQALHKDPPKSEEPPAQRDRTTSPVCGDRPASKSLARPSDGSSQLDVTSSLPSPAPSNESAEELALRLRRSATLPTCARPSTSSASSDRRLSTQSNSSTSSVLTAYPPLTAETYEAFMPTSPLRKAEAENRRLQTRFEATQARLAAASSGRRGVSAANQTTRQLQLDRTKFENMELARRNHEEFLNGLRKMALEVCNDSCTYFRLYRDQFQGQPHLQLLYRQATLYNLFHLRQQVWYQKLVQGRRSAERCLTYIVRDARHPLVSFVHTMASRYLQRLLAVPEDPDSPDSLSDIARDLNGELQRLSEILTLVIQHSRSTTDPPEMNEEEAEDLLPILSRAFYSQTADGPKFHHLALQRLRQSRNADVAALATAMAWPGEQQRATTEVDASLLTGCHEEDIKAFAEGRGHVRALAQSLCPFEKLSAMNRAALAMVEATTRISGRENARDLGADELTPLFAYVVLCWQEPDLLLQCAFLELFAMDKAMLGMEGYSLVSLQASVTFCVDAVRKE